MSKLERCGNPLGAPYFAGVWQDGTRVSVTEVAFNKRVGEVAIRDSNAECGYPESRTDYTGPHQTKESDLRWQQIVAAKRQEYEEALLDPQEWREDMDGVFTDDLNTMVTRQKASGIKRSIKTFPPFDAPQDISDYGILRVAELGGGTE